MAEAVGPTLRAREGRFSRVFFGWWVIAAGSGIQALSAAFFSQAYGAYVVLLREDFGWSKTALAAASSLREAEGGLTGPLQGWLIDRTSVRRVMRAGIVTLGLGFVFFSQVHSLPMFYLAFLIMSVGGSLCGFLSVTYVAVQWFERRRATAIGLVSSGFAVGGMAVPLVVLLLERLGWRPTALISGIVIIVAGLLLTLLIRDRPEQMGLRPDGAEPVRNADGTVSRPVIGSPADFTLREAMATPQFWWIGLGHAFALFIVSAVNVHVISHLKESLGYSLGVAAAFLFLMTTVQFAGTLTGGIIGDRFSKRWLATICMIMHAVALLLVSHATNAGMVVAFALLHGVAWGWRGPQMMAIRADYYGRTSFGKIMGVSNMIIILGTISGPIIAGIVYDTTGNYRLGFDILAMLAAAGSIFFVLSTRPKPPSRLRAGAAAS